ncbi:molybdate ABC transporter permease subunit [Anaeromicropila populeti]|uniref:Molybdenum transport system permease n=1 Tax=Anaeromicropila populeti TaxID=37658 RepID=A0A1I6HW14_9FIRM|nr:molybdate ABC transporter permease subunit [Anaeromicropila populeti]SFR58400.1 molybdate transport system permease protein [Anaeromicropila populeti]
MEQIINKIDWSPLFISIKTGIVATILAFFLGIYLARLVMMTKDKVKWLLDGIFTLPLVLPPTVAGFLLLLLFSVRRPLGAYLYINFNIKIVQTWAGCVIAAFAIAFPLMYRNARGAFEQIDVNLIYAGRTLGLSEFKIFWKIILPSAKPGLLSGMVLTFARALGEYGATTMLAGNILGKTRTISVSIASEAAAGNYGKAGFWVIVIVILSFIIVVSINFLTGKGMKNSRRWSG